MHGAVDIFVGPSGVTTANGTLLLGTKGSAITIEGGAAIFGISSAGAVTVGALTVGP
jgi:hypothetical protein